MRKFRKLTTLAIVLTCALALGGCPDEDEANNGNGQTADTGNTTVVDMGGGEEDMEANCPPGQFLDPVTGLCQGPPVEDMGAGDMASGDDAGGTEVCKVDGDCESLDEVCGGDGFCEAGTRAGTRQAGEEADPDAPGGGCLAGFDVKGPEETTYCPTRCETEDDCPEGWKDCVNIPTAEEKYCRVPLL